MRKLSLENPDIMDKLNHQVIHMDQGVTYTPEYLATREMRNYPSRTAQIIRSVYLGELGASEYGADAVFAPILSGQGERWQNFGEKPEDYLLSVMLGRELFYQKGQKTAEIKELKEKVEKTGSYLSWTKEDEEAWKELLPHCENSHTGLLLDEATLVYTKKTRDSVAAFFKKKEINFLECGPYYTGFDLLAAGLIDEGIAIVEKLIRGWEQKGIRKMITLCGQSQYLFTGLLSYLGLETEIKFISILDLADKMEVKNAYVYGGSYFTRYLGMAGRFNELLVNTEETPITSCPEFLPEVEGDRRKNIVGIWTPPLCAEYHTVGEPEGMEEAIYENALKTIQETSFKKLVVCDPYAYEALKQHHYPEEKLVYFTEILQ